MLAAAAMTASQRVLTQLSVNQLVTVGHEVKLFLVQTVTYGCAKPVSSCFSHPMRSLEQSLWNWKATEFDTLFAIGSVIRYHMLLMHTLHLYFKNCIVRYIPIAEKKRAEKRLPLRPIDPNSASYLTAVYTVASSLA